MSTLYEQRKNEVPELPPCLHNLSIGFKDGDAALPKAHHDELKKAFPNLFGLPQIKAVPSTTPNKALKVGVVLSGGQAAGGHNVICGLFAALQAFDAGSELIGFLDGPGGIIDGKCETLTKEIVAAYLNTGGFNMIGSGRTKIETEEQFTKAKDVIQKLALDGLVVIGGDDSNTNAALLGEYLAQHNIKTTVVGVPKTIDGDLKTEDLLISFGFDTATKTYSEMIGNIGQDALSAKKYTHFIRLMGRSASHIALECALQTQPNYTLISEEVENEGINLKDIVEKLADLVTERSKQGKEYGIFLFPEGVIEFIPEMRQLLKELEGMSSMFKEEMPFKEQCDLIAATVPRDSAETFKALPDTVQKQLLMDKDPHGNVQVSHIATEELFVLLVKKELKKRGFQGKFNPVQHFFGYEGRAGFPTLFDATYTYALGHVAALLIKEEKNGYMACIKNLNQDLSDWEITGIPIPSLFSYEMRKGKKKAVIRKALVDLQGDAFATFQKSRTRWELKDKYISPGPIQFSQKEQLTNKLPKSIQ